MEARRGRRQVQVGADITSFLVPASESGTAGLSLFGITATCATGNSPTTSGTFIQPMAGTYNYLTIDISGTNASSDVVSIALGDNNQASYCFMSGTLATSLSSGYFGILSGINQITVNTWNSGTTSSGTVNSDPPGQTITSSGTSSVAGVRDESLSSGTGLYHAVGGPDSYNWIESPYILDSPPPNFFLDPQGNTYGTVMEACDFPWPESSTIILDNVFHWLKSGTAQKQILEFTDASFTTGTLNLMVNNPTQDPGLSAEYDGPFGAMVLGCSTAGYFGVGSFGTPNTTLLYPSSPPAYQRVWGSDFFTASFICKTGTAPSYTIFYDGTQNSNSYLTSRLSSLPSSITKIATPFTPAAMNDYGNAVGGSYFWSGTALVSLGTNSVVYYCPQ